MLINAAEESYRLGHKAYRAGNKVEALAMFEAAVEMERRMGTDQIQPRYLSYYGMLLALHAGKHRDAIFFCREATTKESYNPDLYYNLGRAYLAAKRRREAVEALHQGLKLEPEHEEILQLLHDIGRRRRPAIPFLSRDNKLNILLGRLTYKKK